MIQSMEFELRWEQCSCMAPLLMHPCEKVVGIFFQNQI